MHLSGRGTLKLLLHWLKPSSNKVVSTVLLMIWVHELLLRYCYLRVLPLEVMSMVSLLSVENTHILLLLLLKAISPA